MSEVTQLLCSVADGDMQASEELLPLVYEDLRALARHKMANERSDHTLQATALVHESYLRLVGQTNLKWNSRGHFYAAAAEAMRRLLVERARRKKRLKHGGEYQRVELEEAEIVGPTSSDNIEAVSEALDRLEEKSPRVAEVVKLRYFAGLKREEIADALGIGARTVDADWSFARAWLFKEIKESEK